MSVDSTVFVLPPMADDLRAALVAEFAPLVHHSDKFQIVFADTAEAGFNVVRLQIRHPKTYGEIVTPQIADPLESIKESSELFFREGFEPERIKAFENGHFHQPHVRVPR